MIIHKETVKITIPLGGKLEAFQKALNMHYLGMENCNKYKYSRMVANYDTSSENGRALEEAHYTLNRSQRVDIVVCLHNDGHLSLE